MTQQTRGSFLQNLRVGQKLQLGFGVMVILAILSGVLTLYTNFLENQAAITLELANEVVLTAEQAEVAFLNADRQLVLFLARWQIDGYEEAYANHIVRSQERLEVSLQRIDHLVEILILENPDEEHIPIAQTATANIQAYQANLETLVDTIERRGFVNTGVEGQIRVLTTNIENSISANPELLILYLQMRRHEKDFITRLDLDDAETVRTFANDLKAQIPNLGLSTADENALTQAIDNYITNFNILVELELEIEQQIAQIESVVEGTTALTTQIVEEETVEATRILATFRGIQQTVSITTPTIVIITLGLGIFIAVSATRSIVDPVQNLTNTAQEISRGDFSQRVHIQSRDELGQLGTNFNRMVERIVARNRDVQAIVDVSEQITTIFDEDRLLQDVVDLVKERFSLYHAHIYGLNETGDTLVLTAGAGYVGRRMVAENRIIAIENRESIVAGTARSRGSIVVNNVRASENFLPHPLLPDTTSELAVALIARGQLLGVLDVQSDKVDFFDNETLAIMQTLAAQISNALSNARLYQSAQRTARHSEAMSQIQVSMQSAIDMDDMIERTTHELAKALRVPYAAIEFALDAPNGHLSVDDNHDEGEK